MSDPLPREGSRLGPYLLGRRLPDSDPELGHVYEAHHGETGAPSLVLVPDAAHPWAPRAAWTARSRAEVSPPLLAMEVERTPGASPRALHELTVRSIALSSALASVEDREDTAAFLAQGPRAAPRSPPRRRALALGLAALGGLALGVGVMLLGPRGLVPPFHDGEDPVARRVSGEIIHWTQLIASPTPSVGFPLPSEPLRGQHKPPCVGRAAVEINGGCWVALESHAPCDQGYAEHQGKCYMPVREPVPEPRSVEP